MSILDYNTRIIDKIEQAEKRNIEIIKSIKETIQDMGNKPKDLDFIKNGLGKISNELSIIRCKYNEIYNEYLLFNGKFLCYNQQDSQQISIFLANTVIKPEDYQLISYIENSIAKLFSHYNENDRSKDFINYNNVFGKFDDFSEDRKLIVLWNQILINFKEWSIIRAKIINLKIIINYINCVQNQ